MKFLSGVVWSEGMYLAPHHFQAQSRYFEDTAAFLAQNLSSYPWGLIHLEMDAKAVANGSVSLLHASGIFPDGLMFDMPSSDARPAIRAVSSLCEPTDSEIRLHLAVPVRNRNSPDDNANHPRYSAILRTLRDETNGLDEYDVEFKRKNITIVAERELTPDCLALPIARLVREASGHFRYDGEFIPPLLRVGASESLTHMLRRLLEVIAEKCAAISRPIQTGKQFEAGSLPMDIANYWFLHALHSALPPLRQLVEATHSRPSDCFLELSRLGGALCTFSLDSDPRTLPSYDHGAPGPAFLALAKHIQQQLEIVVPSNTVTLQFSPAEPFIHAAPVRDERCLYRSRWVLGVRSSIGGSEQLHLVPRLVKICSARFVPELVKRALPGMTLTYLPVPPSALRAEVDMQYFAIDTTGPCWNHILQTRKVGVYIPGEIAGAHFTLTVILEQIA